MNFVSGIIQNSVAGFVDAGMRTAGGYAGDFLIKAGDSIESAGTAYGNAVAGKFDNWGGSIKASGPGPKPTLPKGNLITSGPKQLARSNSTPASSNRSKTSTALTKSSAKPGVSKAATYKPETKRIAVTRSASTNSVKPKSNSGNLKYTPGVVTGLPKGRTGAPKPASQLSKTSNTSSNKPAGGETKYTPGKVTGLPTKGAAKSTQKPDFPSPAKTAPKGTNTSKPAGDKDKKEKNTYQKIDRTFF